VQSDKSMNFAPHINPFHLRQNIQNRYCRTFVINAPPDNQDKERSVHIYTVQLDNHPNIFADRKLLYPQPYIQKL
jgi:hypothetical protein